MPLVYRQEYDENGNVIDPLQLWLVNNNTLAGVINGDLDRDNLPQATIAAAEVTSQTFNVVHSAATDTTYTPDKTSTDWQGGTGNDATGVVSYQWTAAQDAHYDIHWSGEWAWNGTSSLVEDNTAVDAAGLPDRRFFTDTVDTVEFKISIDGNVIATAGPFSDTQNNMATYIIGCAQLVAGVHTLRVECAMFRRVAQTDVQDGVTTNTLVVGSRCWVMIQRQR